MFWVENRTFQSIEKVNFTWSPNWIFPKGLDNAFGQKFEISSLFLFGPNRPRNCGW